MLKFLIGCSFLLISLCEAKADDNDFHSWRVGLNYGQATLQKFPSNSPDYIYKNQFIKAQINYGWFKKGQWHFEIHLEPSVYWTDHQLLNPYFLTPKFGDNYLELRDVYTQARSFNEYALNVGFLARYPFPANFSTYALGSVGPMYSGADTERLKKGFGFSDVFGLGVSYQLNGLTFDLRYTFRHNSNADLFFPNAGHNSSGLEMGVWIKI